MLAFSSCSKQGLLSGCGRRLLVTVDSLVAGHGLWGSRASVALACGQLIVIGHRLSCSTACGIFQDQGSNLCLLLWQADFCHWVTRKPLPILLDLLYFWISKIHKFKGRYIQRSPLPISFPYCYPSTTYIILGSLWFMLSMFLFAKHVWRCVFIFSSYFIPFLPKSPCTFLLLACSLSPVYESVLYLYVPSSISWESLTITWS